MGQSRISTASVELYKRAHDRVIKRSRRRTVRWAILISNVLLLGLVIYFVAKSSDTTQTASQNVSDNSSSVFASNPLDQLSSADIAFEIASLVHLDQIVSVKNNADSINDSLSVAPAAASVVAKPQIISTAGQNKSNKDIQKYVTQAGDTVSSLAAKFGITSDTIRWSNDLSGNSLAVGKYPKWSHRWAYEFFMRPLWPGEVVMHTCNNKLCCSPFHLFAGDQKANIRDSVMIIGKSNSELDPDTVYTIRQLAFSGWKPKDIAEGLSVKLHTVRDCISGKTWSWFMPLQLANLKDKTWDHSTGITAEQAKELKRLWVDGFSPERLAAIFNVSEDLVRGLTQNLCQNEKEASVDALDENLEDQIDG